MNFPARNAVRRILLAGPLLAITACGGGGSGAIPARDANVIGGGEAIPTNRAPLISGAAPSVARIGEPYVFQPDVSDPDGDALGIKAGNLPPWARLDPQTGRISGTPRPGDEGIHESITLTVADAARSAELGPFSIYVTAPPVARLTWERPPSKVDGTPLDDLAGFRILYGRSAEDLDHSILISNPAQTTYEFAAEELGSGIWYFAVVGVNEGGLEGPPTVPAMKSI